VPALATLLLVLVASILPRVEDPIPDRIGLGTLLAWAGFGGAIAGILYSAASNSRRDEAIKWGGVLGFAVAASLYLVSLIVQVASGL
jgi:hypothetical protein